jgi:hypothetical protein
MYSLVFLNAITTVFTIRFIISVFMVKSEIKCEFCEKIINIGLFLGIGYCAYEFILNYPANHQLILINILLLIVQFLIFFLIYKLNSQFLIEWDFNNFYFFGLYIVLSIIGLLLVNFGE